MLIYRSGQFQAAALAGEVNFLDYNEFPLSGGLKLKFGDPIDASMWIARQNLDAWKDKPLKELKQINMDWKTMNYEQPGGTTVYATPNGNPYDNEGYYTQTTKFYGDGYDKEWNDYWDTWYKQNPIERDAEKYSNWEDMHKDVMWFDTAGCWGAPFIGQANSVTIKPDGNTVAAGNVQLNEDKSSPATVPTAASDANGALNAGGSSGVF
jgi:hypothetical protein